MTKMLSLTPAEMTAGMLTPLDLSRGRLERAKEALARVDAFGLQEHFEDSALPSRPLRVDLGEPESLRARIAEDNAFDAELYEVAKRLHGRARRGGR